MQSLKVLLTSIAHKFVMRAWLDLEVQASGNVEYSHVIVYNQTLRDMHVINGLFRFSSVSKSVHELPHGMA